MSILHGGYDHKSHIEHARVSVAPKKARTPRFTPRLFCIAPFCDALACEAVRLASVSLALRAQRMPNRLK